jgi:aspartate kinase
VERASGSHETIVVWKVGGSILSGTKAYRRVALYLKQRTKVAPEEKLVVVVSAQKNATSVLERRARHIVRSPGVRALDLLWSTGELRSVAVLALHLEALSVRVVGLNVHETGLQIADAAGVNSPRPTLVGRSLRHAVASHAVVIVPGFLAARADQAIVTLGRGGSDLTAVLLAIGLRASRCELLKDVPGYFEEDPHRNACAAHLPSLGFDEALRMAERGCDLVQPQALQAAAYSGLSLVVRSLDERAPSSVISRCAEPSSAVSDQEKLTVEAQDR